MNSLKIYRVRDGYIQYLHSFDNRVMYNKGQRRPYVGVVLEVNDNRYFVPMESPKPNHANIKGGIHVMRMEDGKYGLLGFNNMIPVGENLLISFDINQEPDIQYRELLRNQLRFCNHHKAEILERARKTYEAVTVKKIPFFTKVCCDFKLLEEKSKKYVFKKTIT